MPFNLEKIKQNLSYYKKEKFNQGGYFRDRKKNKGYRAVQLLIAEEIAHHASLDDTAKATALQIIADTINGTNAGSNSKLRDYISTPKLEITYGQSLSPAGIANKLNNNMNSDVQVVKALAVVMDKIQRAQIDPKIKQIIIDTWVSGAQKLLDSSNLQEFPVLQKFIQEIKPEERKQVDTATNKILPYVTAAKKLKEDCKALEQDIEVFEREELKSLEPDDPIQKIKSMGLDFIKRGCEVCKATPIDQKDLDQKKGKITNWKIFFEKLKKLGLQEIKAVSIEAKTTQLDVKLTESESSLSQGPTFYLMKDASNIISLDQIPEKSKKNKKLIPLLQKRINNLKGGDDQYPELRIKINAHLKEELKAIREKSASPEFSEIKEIDDFINDINVWNQSVWRDLRAIRSKIGNFEDAFDYLAQIEELFYQKSDDKAEQEFISSYLEVDRANLIASMNGNTEIDFNKTLNSIREKINLLEFYQSLREDFFIFLEKRTDQPKGIITALSSEFKEIKEACVKMMKKPEGNILENVRNLRKRFYVLQDGRNAFNAHISLRNQIEKVEEQYGKQKDFAKSVAEDKTFERELNKVSQEIKKLKEDLNTPFMQQESELKLVMPDSKKSKMELAITDLRKRQNNIKSNIDKVQQEIVQVGIEIPYISIIRSGINFFKETIQKLRKKILGADENKKNIENKEEKKSEQIPRTESILPKSESKIPDPSSSSGDDALEAHYKDLYGKLKISKTEVELEKIILAMPVESEKEDYKCRAWYLLRKKLNEFKELSDSISKSQVSVPELALKILQFNKTKESISKLLAAVDLHYDVYNLNGILSGNIFTVRFPRLAKNSLQFTPLLDKFHREFNQNKRNVFGHLCDLFLEKNKDYENYAQKVVELVHGGDKVICNMEQLKSQVLKPDFKKNSSSEEIGKENYKTYAYYLLREKLNALQDSAEKIFFMSNEEIEGEQKEIFGKIFEIEDIFSKVKFIFKTNSISSSHFETLLKTMSNDFYRLIKVFSDKGIDILSEYFNKKAQYNEQTESKQSEFLVENEASFYSSLSEELVKIEQTGRDIVRWQQELKQLNIEKLKVEMPKLEKKMREIQTLKDNFEGKLKKAREKFPAMTFYFDMALINLSEKTANFSEGVFQTLKNNYDNLNDLINKAEYTKSQICHNLAILADSNLARAEEIVKSIGEDSSLEVSSLVEVAKDALVKKEIPEDVEEQKDSKFDGRYEEREIEKIKPALSDKEIYQLLKKNLPEEMAIYDELEAAMRDILSNLSDRSVDSEIAELVKRLQGEFVLSPKMFLYDYLKPLSLAEWHEILGSQSDIVDCARIKMTCESQLAAVLKLGERIIIDYPTKLNDKTIHLMARRVLKQVPTESTPNKTKLRGDLTALMNESRKLKNNDVRDSICFALIKTVERIRGLETGIADSLKSFFDTLYQSVSGSGIKSITDEKADRTENMEIFLSEILTFNDPLAPNGKMAIGLTAHKAKQWLDKALTWERGKCTSTHLVQFREILIEVMQQSYDIQSSSVDKIVEEYLGPQAKELKEVKTDPDKLSSNIRGNLRELLIENNQDQLLIGKLAKFLSLDKLRKEEDKEQWKVILKIARLTEESLLNLMEVNGLAATIDYVNRRVATLYDGILVQQVVNPDDDSVEMKVYNNGSGSIFVTNPENGRKIKINQGFIKKMLGKLGVSAVHFADVRLELCASSQDRIQLKLLSERDQAVRREEKTGARSNPGLSPEEQEEQEILSKLIKLKHAPIKEEALDAHTRSVERRHKEVKEIESDATQIFELTKHLNGLVNSQGCGVREFDLLIQELDDKDDPIAKAEEISRKEKNKRYPVLIKQKGQIFIYGDSSFTQYKLDDIFLVTINDIKNIVGKTRVEFLKSLEKETCILAKDNLGNFYSLKFSSSHGWQASSIGSPRKEIIHGKLIDQFPSSAATAKKYNGVCDENLREALIQKGRKGHYQLNKWNGNDLILLTVNDMKNIPTEKLKDLEKTRTVILVKAKGSRDVFMLKFNGIKWAPHPKKIEKCQEIVDKFPQEVFQYVKHEECSLPLMKEIKSKGGFKNWRLTPLQIGDLKAVGGCSFSKKPTLVHGYSVEGAVWEGIIKAEGHLAPCIDTMSMLIADAKKECAAAYNELKLAEKYLDRFLKGVGMFSGIGSAVAKRLAPHVSGAETVGGEVARQVIMQAVG